MLIFFRGFLKFKGTTPPSFPQLENPRQISENPHQISSTPKIFRRLRRRFFGRYTVFQCSFSLVFYCLAPQAKFLSFCKFCLRFPLVLEPVFVENFKYIMGFFDCIKLRDTQQSHAINYFADMDMDMES